MTAPRFSLAHVYLALALLYGTSVMAAQPDGQVDRFAKAYRATRTDSERRAVCLEAIDAGVVARDHSVADVDAIFGTKYATRLPRKGTGLEVGVVDFHPTPRSGNNAVASGSSGWYLTFEFDSDGRLQNYYLTNLHK